MAPTSLLLTRLLPRDAIQLGRLVVNPEDPEAEFCQPDAIPPDAAKQAFTDLKHTSTGERGLALKLGLLMRLLHLSPSTSASISDDLSSHSLTVYTLRNSGDYFDTACKEDKVRRFLERQAQRRFGRAFLVCGFQTVEDANVRQTRGHDDELSGGITVPASVVAGAVSGGASLLIPPVADADLVAAEVTHTSKSNEEVRYNAPGESVFAVQYRKVRFAWLAADTVGSATLESNHRWKLYGPHRGEAGEDHIEASLDVAAELQELVSGDYESLDIDGETFVYRVAKEEEEEELEASTSRRRRQDA